MIPQDLAYLFVNELFSCYRLLMDIVTVRDTKFRSDFWMQVFKKLESTLSMSFIDHPQPHGQTKGVNKIIEDMLRGYVGRKPVK